MKSMSTDKIKSARQLVEVELGDRSYPIHIGTGLLGDTSLIKPYIRGRQVCVVSNDTVAPLYMDTVCQSLAGFDITQFIFPDGEEYKTIDTVSTLYDHMLETNFGRSATLVALGGGVVGDMVGFAAATYQRGIDFIQIPTTLLSQVDSSVGGKTGVNRPLGKNMVGAFYQPKCVLADCDTLDTLPDRELKAGLAEVIKYGLINNREFLDWLDANLDSLLARDLEALAYAVRVSCEEKAAIVAMDEREGGIRAILNLGHTFGHAIETAMGYGTWLHGEAVATGMVMAAAYSQRQGLLSQADADYVRTLVGRAGLPISPPDAMDAETFISYMGRDKKAESGRIRLILLERLGKAFVSDTVETGKLTAELSAGL